MQIKPMKWTVIFIFAWLIAACQPAERVLIFRDDFTSQQWDTGTDENSSVEYVNNALQFLIYKENFFVWSTPDDRIYENIHMEAVVANNDSDSTTAFGFLCNKSVTDEFYYLAMTPAGQYVIAKAMAGQPDLFLTNNDSWANSEKIAPNVPSYRIGADCGHGRLTLYVDGEEIASVNDLSFTSGGVALFVWSGEEVGLNTNIGFDDFSMTTLP